MVSQSLVNRVEIRERRQSIDQRLAAATQELEKIQKEQQVLQKECSPHPNATTSEEIDTMVRRCPDCGAEERWRTDRH